MIIKLFGAANVRRLLLLAIAGTSLVSLNGCIIELGAAERGHGHVEIEPRPVEVEPVIVVEPEHERR